VTSAVVIRVIESLDEVRQVEELQREAWGMDDRDLVPLSELIAVRDSGGQLIGAFAGPVLVGFVYGFVAMEGGRVAHHSHLLAVKPSHRGADIGYRLKLAQRERVLAQGIQRMTWTFDPLQSLNAHFNFCKLGVLSDTYRVNLYGERSSSFLHRGGTDRLWVTWLLASRRVRQRLEGAPREPAVGPDVGSEVEAEGRRLIEVGDDGSPSRRAVGGGECRCEQALLEIPADINALERQRPERAAQWREATRAAFSEALASGFLIEGFRRMRRDQGPVGTYLLRRQRTLGDFDEHSS
jgi:predicted GNAT superfamily acetyltransferase